jgi:predicted ATP-grasp superfamily ATP-dependent carboligase
VDSPDVSTPAVVLKLDANVFHHGGLGVIRSLGRMGVPVHAVHEDLLSPAASSRYVHGRWRWVPDSRRSERILEGLAVLGERIGRPSVVIPTDDAGAIFLAEHSDALGRWFLLSEPEPHLPRRIADKDTLARMCRDAVISCPPTEVPCSLEDALAFVDRVGLPAFAKRVRPWEPPRRRRLRSTTLVRTRAEVVALCHDHVGEVLLQEAVLGGPDWFFHGYCDAGSTCSPAFTGVKERSYPPRAGLTTLGLALPNEELRSRVQALLWTLRYRGLVDIDLRWDASSDRFLLLDFNPRIGAQFRLFEDAAGIDVVRAAYLDLTGQPVPDALPVTGRRFIVENYDLLAAIDCWRRGELGMREWARTLRLIDETAWFARDDLAPFGLMCLRFGWRMVERPFRRKAGAASARALRYRPGRGWQPGASGPCVSARPAQTRAPTRTGDR